MPENAGAGAGQLVLVATPIGNLGDLSPRAIEALKAAALICCEDTRRTGKLLQHAGIAGKRLAVCNEHTERDRVGDVLAVLGDGGSVAVVTDAGTPGISDPGEWLAKAAIGAGYDVSTVPGPTALVSALVTSGLPSARFVFEGFLPRSGSSRRDRLAAVAAERRTVVLYEAPHRIVRTIADLSAACGDDRPVAVARELTKLYETVERGTLGTIDLGTPRGEYVIVLGGKPPDESPADPNAIDAALDELLAAGLSTKEAAADAAGRFGISRRDAYAAAIARRTTQKSARNGLS
jgi:16S rRNA (cytidine1402-2'-O)-methyltransferase